MTRAIGIFDSGLGGLSLVEEINKLLPNESTIYLSDSANFPYGDKKPAEIRKITENNVAWLLRQNVKLIVVACNTATVNSITYLRKKFSTIKFVGMEPAVKPASKLSRKGIIILSSPKATKSKQLQSLIDKYAKEVEVHNIGSLKLVRAIEEKRSSKDIKKVLKELFPEKLMSKFDVIVLGCTHFPLIRKQIQAFVGNKVKVVDSGEAVARRVESVLSKNDKLSQSKKAKQKYYTTGPVISFSRTVFGRINI